MKSKFLIPKIALLALLLGFLAQKFIIANDDLKAGQKDDIEAVNDFQESPDYQPAGHAPVAYSQTGETPGTSIEPTDAPQPAEGAPEESDGGGFWQFIKSHLVEVFLALFALLEIIVRATPTQKDDSILNFIKSIFDSIIPNRRTGGGLH